MTAMFNAHFDVGHEAGVGLLQIAHRNLQVTLKTRSNHELVIQLGKLQEEERNAQKQIDRLQVTNS